MKRFLIHFLMILCMVTFWGIGLGTTSHAYTEEEKQQAKAWLSAHGYSPDAGGASQAYQDYLDGKFDEELGINSTEQDSTDNSTTEAASQTNQASTTENTSASDTGSTTEKSSDNITGSKAEKTSENSFDANGSTEQNMEVSEKNTATENATADENEKEEKVTKEETSHETDGTSQHKGDITLYQQEKMDTYKDALLVIGLAVLLTTIAEGFILLL
jgi:uncharacterized membrane protein YdfJ with MMPL/SSD domain